MRYEDATTTAEAAAVPEARKLARVMAVVAFLALALALTPAAAMAGYARHTSHVRGHHRNVRRHHKRSRRHAHGIARLRPCDLYAKAGTPCVAAFSSTRALFAGYEGPLYEVKRASDGATLNVGVLTRGGYANAGAQNAFCAGTSCVVEKIRYAN